jgi:SAM-dependent methyltransferase
MDGPGGWRQALDRLDLPIMSRKRFWFTDLKKSAFYQSIPGVATKAVLDVGSGSGVIAEGLAGSFGQVVALERDPKWCRFIHRRFRQDGITNVAVICGDAIRAPLGKDRFDLVVVNGVLEWVPEGDRSGSPRDVQLAFLRRMRESLRADGSIGIAIENRFCLSHFFGVTPHGEPAWTVILPRPLASLITRVTRGAPYRTWIYSPWGYKRLLREAGFRNIEVFQALPTYHQPEVAASLWDAEQAREYFPTTRPAKRFMRDLLTRAKLLGLLAHSFYISAHK